MHLSPIHLEHLELSGNEIEFLLTSLGELAATVLSFLNETHLLKVVDAVTNDVTVGLKMIAQPKIIT